MDAKRLLLIEEDGDFKALVGDTREDLRGFVGRYRPLGRSSRLLVLRREAGGGLEGAEDRILMAGEILAENTVLDVVGMIVASRWTGAFHVHGRNVHRVLGFEDGLLRFARSDDPEDRLNKVLFRLGILSPAESEEVERRPRSDQRFGEALVRKGLMDEKELFGHLERQMVEIYHSAILTEDGCFLFMVGDRWLREAPVTAYLPMQQLLFDGAERLSRFSELERLVPSEALCPAVRPGLELTRLAPRERRLLGFCDGSRSIREIARESWWGRFRTVEMIYDLVKRDCLELREPKRSPAAAAEALVAPCAAALREITAAVGRDGDLKRLHQEVRRWVEGSEMAAYLGSALTERLTLEPTQIAAVLDELQFRDREEIVAHALHELVAFALFAASFSLSRTEEEELRQRVREHLTGAPGVVA